MVPRTVDGWLPLSAQNSTLSPGMTRNPPLSFIDHQAWRPLSVNVNRAPKS